MRRSSPATTFATRHTLILRRAAIVAAFVLALAAAPGPAWATSFTSTDEPPTITIPSVSTLAGAEGILNITVGVGFTCPDDPPTPYTVTFSDPSGTVSVTTSDPCDGTWGSVTPAVPPPDVLLDFTPEPGENLSFLDGTGEQFALSAPPEVLIGLEPDQTTPFLYQVSTPAGIVAQAAMTLDVTTTAYTEIDEKNNIDEFINVCIDGNHTLYSKDNGDLYCEVGGVTTESFVSGWPAPPPPTPPVLAGPWAPSQEGYGHTKPSTVSSGGDPTGIVRHVHWTSWGGTQAVGSGISDYVGPHQTVAGGKEEKARIVAFEPGMCHGRSAYNAIEWYFPQHGQHFSAGTYINACTGTYYQGGKPIA